MPFRHHWPFLLLFALAVQAAMPEPPERLHHHLDNAHTFQLKGHVRSAVAVAQDLGPVPDSQTLSSLSLHFSLTPTQAADLARLQAQLQDPASPQFHKFLTPEQYAARFGLNTKDLEKVQRWLEQNGFSDVEIARSRTWIKFSGTAAVLQNAFRTTLHRYALNGKEHFANATDPFLPKALEGVVTGISGLHNFQPEPNAHTRPLLNFSSGDHGLVPDDIATIYNLKPLYNEGMDGSGVKIAIPAQSNVDLSDIRAFRTAAGLSANDPQIVLVTTDPGLRTGDETESELDLEIAGGVAPNATVLLVIGNPTSGNGVDDALQHIVDQNLAPIISLSYTYCEKDMTASDFNSASNLLAQAAAQGITILAGSGDSGPAACDSTTPIVKGPSVSFPASSPYVTGVGGTTLTGDITGAASTYWKSPQSANYGSALAYIPEAAWDDQNASTKSLSATSGGASTFAAKPSWQTGPGVPNDGARDVPDVAFSASPDHDPYILCISGSCVNGFGDASGYIKTVYGGTSATAPLMAAITALLVQKTGQPQGNINPRLYAIASTAPSAFHDVTQGSVIFGCDLQASNCPFGQFGFTAGPGYDQTTGLGSIDAFNLLNAWPDFGLSSNPASLTIARGTSGASVISVSPVNGFNDAVTLSCSVSNSLTNVTCSIPARPASGTATLTITASATAASLPGWKWPPTVLLLPVAAWLLWRMRRSALLPRAAYACLLLSITLIGTTSCGNGSASGGSPTPAPVVKPISETGTVTVKAVANTAQTSVNISISVQ